MREFLFRGKGLITGEWCYGFYADGVILTSLDIDEDYFGTSEEWESVDFETVGQYTGLKDKNGNKIFEGDIVRFEDYTYFEGMTNEFFSEGAVEYDQFGFYFTDRSTINMEDFYIDDNNKMEDVEIIGNIHDKD